MHASELTLVELLTPMWHVNWCGIKAQLGRKTNQQGPCKKRITHEPDKKKCNWMYFDETREHKCISARKITAQHVNTYI